MNLPLRFALISHLVALAGCGSSSTPAPPLPNAIPALSTRCVSGNCVAAGTTTAPGAETLMTTLLAGNSAVGDWANALRVFGESGPIEIINGLTGSSGTGAGSTLYANGISDCASIPATGTLTKGDYTVAFDTPSSTLVIPSHFGADAGKTFDKKLTARYQGTLFLTAQLKCVVGTTVKTAYFRLTDPVTQDTFETYFQLDVASHAAYVDFFAIYPDNEAAGGNGIEKDALRLVSADGVSYSLYFLRTVDGGPAGTVGEGRNGIYVAANGNATTGVALVNFLMSTGSSVATNSAVISNAANSTCFNLSTNASTTGCAAVSDPTDSSPINGTVFPWTLKGLYNLTLSTF